MKTSLVRLPEGWLISALAFTASCIGLLVGLISLATTAADGYAMPALGLLAVTLYILSLSRRFTRRQRDLTLDVLVAVAAGSALLLLALPPYLYATPNTLRFHGIIHRSVFSAILLIGVSLPATCSTLNYLFGETPGAHDLSRYPLLILPALLAVGLYGLILWSAVAKGLPALVQRPSVLWESYMSLTPGLGRHILGTLTLVALTAAISLPIGVGTGVYLAEYATGVLGQWITTATTALRSISVFILGLGAMYAVRLARGTFLADLICGYQIDHSGFKASLDGTYVTAALFLSLLVIPIVARAAEEGCRAVPRDLREGSWALAASEGYTLWRVLLPWAWPNIITGLLLGCAEAAGDVAVIMFVAKTVDAPFRLLDRPTGLAFLLFEMQSSSNLQEIASPFLIALLLILLTMGLNIAALIVKNHFAARYRGNL